MSVSELVQLFKFTEVLHTDPQTKSLILLGTIKGEQAIVNLEKSHFIVENDQYDLKLAVKNLEIINNNDVYYWSLAELSQKLPEVPGAKLNLIFPATETHINKYRLQQVHYITETPEVYAKYVVPYINTMKGDRIKWVHNILFEGKEAESFVYHDEDKVNGFVLLPDMKWDKINMDTLYLCAIVKRLDVSSVRDLNGSHLPYLIGMKQKIIDVTSEKYPVEKDHLRIFIHYQPSYYHFHIHVVNIKHPGLGNGIAVGKAILLDDVIENIKLLSDYYQKCNLSYVLGENHGLWKDEGFREAHAKSLN